MLETHDVHISCIAPHRVRDIRQQQQASVARTKSTRTKRLAVHVMCDVLARNQHLSVFYRCLYDKHGGTSTRSRTDGVELHHAVRLEVG